MKEILQQIERIKDKLNRVSKTDKHFKLFGSESHKYKLNKTLTEKEIVEFENNYSIRLPDEYRFYLQHISNGGAGPYYGIQKLSDSIFEDLDYKKTD